VGDFGEEGLPHAAARAEDADLDAHDALMRVRHEAGKRLMAGSRRPSVCGL
jgi:hypothetical protein